MRPLSWEPAWVQIEREDRERSKQLWGEVLKEIRGEVEGLPPDEVEVAA